MVSIDKIMHTKYDKKKTRKRTKKYLNLHLILGLNIKNFYIYFSLTLISLVCLIVCLFISDFWKDLLLSLGCSIISGILISFFIELVNNKNMINNKILDHNIILFSIYGSFYSIIENVKNFSINSKKDLTHISNLCYISLKDTNKLLDQYTYTYGEYIDNKFYINLCSLNSYLFTIILTLLDILENNNTNEFENNKKFITENLVNWIDNNITASFLTENLLKYN